MRRDTTPALEAAVRSFAGSPWLMRLHILGRRWLSCLETVEALVPESGHILEVGCGHGLFSRYLALAAPHRRVTGIDIDDFKLAAVANSPDPTGRVRLAWGDARHLPAGPDTATPGWDVVVYVDILFFLNPAGQAESLRSAAAALKPGGHLICKAQETTPTWKYRLCEFQERLATGLGITVGESLSLLPRQAMVEAIAAAGFGGIRSHIVPGRIYPDVIHTATKPAATSALRKSP